MRQDSSSITLTHDELNTVVDALETLADILDHIDPNAEQDKTQNINLILPASPEEVVPLEAVD